MNIKQTWVYFPAIAVCPIKTFKCWEIQNTTESGGIEGPRPGACLEWPAQHSHAGQLGRN